MSGVLLNTIFGAVVLLGILLLHSATNGIFITHLNFDSVKLAFGGNSAIFHILAIPIVLYGLIACFVIFIRACIMNTSIQDMMIICLLPCLCLLLVATVSQLIQPPKNGASELIESLTYLLAFYIFQFVNLCIGGYLGLLTFHVLQS